MVFNFYTYSRERIFYVITFRVSYMMYAIPENVDSYILHSLAIRSLLTGANSCVVNWQRAHKRWYQRMQIILHSLLEFPQ